MLSRRQLQGFVMRGRNLVSTLYLCDSVASASVSPSIGQELETALALLHYGLTTKPQPIGCFQSLHPSKPPDQLQCHDVSRDSS